MSTLENIIASLMIAAIGTLFAVLVVAGLAG